MRNNLSKTVFQVILLMLLVIFYRSQLSCEEKTITTDTVVVTAPPKVKEYIYVDTCKMQFYIKGEELQIKDNLELKFYYADYIDPSNHDSDSVGIFEIVPTLIDYGFVHHKDMERCGIARLKVKIINPKMFGYGYFVMLKFYHQAKISEIELNITDKKGYSILEKEHIDIYKELDYEKSEVMFEFVLGTFYGMGKLALRPGIYEGFDD